MFWSGGKDSALALYKIQQENKYEIVSLITTINKEFNRVSMHGIRIELIEKQADSIGVSLHKMFVDGGSHNEYEEKLKEVLKHYVDTRITKVVYGDIALEDLKEYRDNLLLQVGMTGIYPLWKQPTSKLIYEFLDLNFKTTICCIYTQYLAKGNVGKIIDNQFINELKNVVDPCGENGEFHTFCWSGPIFKKSIRFSLGKKIFKPVQMPNNKDKKSNEGFWFIDLIPTP